MSISKKIIHQPLSEPIPKLPVTHRVLGPAFSDLTNPAVVEVRNSENGGFSLAQILDSSNSELLVKFIDPLIKDSMQIWVRSDQVRPQPPIVTNDDVQYQEGEYIQFFNEQHPLKGWWNAKVISPNHPFYLIECNNSEQIVHFNSTRKCNLLSIQPLFSHLYHHQINIPSHLLNTWKEHGPPNFKMIKQSSGALQIRDVLSDMQGKIVFLGNNQSILQAEFLIQAAFDHFEEIYQKEEENKVAFPQPSLQDIEDDQFLEGHDEIDVKKSSLSSSSSSISSKTEQREQKEQSEYRIKYSEFILPNQISIKYTKIFDRCDQTSKKYKGQFIVPQNLVGLVLGKQKVKLDNIRKRQQILGIYYDTLQELGDDRSCEQRKQKVSSSNKRPRSATLFTVFGVNKQCVKTAVQELYLIQHDLPLQVEICEYLHNNQKLSNFQQKSNIQKISIDSTVYLSQDDIKYQNVIIIGSPKSVKNCKAIIQMFLEMEYKQLKDDSKIDSINIKINADQPIL